MDAVRSAGHDQLTEREEEILRLIAEGFSNQQIADQLFLSLGTVKWYNQQIFQKLGVRSRTQAILLTRELERPSETAPTVRKDRRDRVLNTNDSLNPREKDILTCLVEGLSNQEIAIRLHLALRTVKWYNSQIYSKLGVSNRREAVEEAQRRGFDENRRVEQPRHHIPHQVTPFIGRRQELAELTQLLTQPETRLVTILAPGGMGKTRLALATAERVLQRFVDGVFFVSLAPLSAAGSMITAIAECIGYTFYGENTPTQQLIDYLQDRTALLVLDNFEHLLNGAPLVSAILEAAPGVRVLVTSRERLNLHGETIYLLGGMDFPAPEARTDAREYDAVAMFIESARRARANFLAQPGDLESLARICRLTGGMPLGIELAAGWMDVLSITQIEGELHQGIDILETDLRDVPERQRSMRANFELTWRRLGADEQAIFARLSVFRGGFTLSAARAVADANTAHLRKLAQKALIQPEGHERFTIHELLRQFGTGKLTESGDVLAVRARHAAFFVDFMAERMQDIKTDRQLEALGFIDRDFENVNLAWSYLISHQQWEQIPAFLFSLWFYCDVRARGQEALGLLELAELSLRKLPSSAVVELALGRVLAPIGWFYKEIGLAEKALTTCAEAVRILRQLGSPEDLLTALFYYQNAAGNLFQPEIVVNTAEEGVRIAQSVGDRYWEGHFLLWAGAGLQDGIEIRYGHTRQFAVQALALFEESGDRWGIMRANEVLGNSYRVEGENELAKYYLEQALAHAEIFDKAQSIAVYHVFLAQTAFAEHNHTASREHYRQALQIYWHAGFHWIAPYPLQGLAQVYIDQQDFGKAITILAAISSHRLLFAHTDRTVQVLRAELAGQMEPEHFESAWALGQQRSLSALVAKVLDEPDDTS